MARIAVRLGPSDPTVLSIGGHSLGYLTDEYDLSLSLTQQALALNPNSATALQLGSWARLYAGHPERAMVHFGRGTRLNPIDTKRFILDSGLAYACMMLARYDEAAGWARKSLASAPHWAFASIPLAGALVMLGRREEAQVVVGQLLAQNPRYTARRRSFPCEAERLRIGRIPDGSAWR
jgi:tetratricopeptide (TPR) repeat protein